MSPVTIYGNHEPVKRIVCAYMPVDPRAIGYHFKDAMFEALNKDEEMMEH